MKKNSISRIFDDLGLLTLSLALFLGGGYLLSLRIPFWSMFLGIAAIQIGIVLIIFTFEIFTKRKSKVLTEDYKAIPCLICKQLSYVPKYKNTNICDQCQIRIARAAKIFMVVIFSLFSLSSLTILVRQSQDIRRQATEEKYQCQEGIWNPQSCRCAIEEKFNCPEGWISRICSDEVKYCCQKTVSGSLDEWNCQKVE